jgi:hypothetical protein
MRTQSNLERKAGSHYKRWPNNCRWGRRAFQHATTSALPGCPHPSVSRIDLDFVVVRGTATSGWGWGSWSAPGSRGAAGAAGTHEHSVTVTRHACVRIGRAQQGQQLQALSLAVALQARLAQLVLAGAAALGGQGSIVACKICRAGRGNKRVNHASGHISKTEHEARTFMHRKAVCSMQLLSRLLIGLSLIN